VASAEAPIERTTIVTPPPLVWKLLTPRVTSPLAVRVTSTVAVTAPSAESLMGIVPVMLMLLRLPSTTASPEPLPNWNWPVQKSAST
jgi:hypothetical protein